MAGSMESVGVRADRPLCQSLPRCLSAHIGEAAVATRVPASQPLVIESGGMQNDLRARTLSPAGRCRRYFPIFQRCSSERMKRALSTAAGEAKIRSSISSSKTILLPSGETSAT